MAQPARARLFRPGLWAATSTAIPAGAYGKIPRHNVFVARMQYALPGVPLLVAKVATASGTTLLPS